MIDIKVVNQGLTDLLELLQADSLLIYRHTGRNRGKECFELSYSWGKDRLPYDRAPEGWLSKSLGRSWETFQDEDCSQALLKQLGEGGLCRMPPTHALTGPILIHQQFHVLYASKIQPGPFFTLSKVAGFREHLIRESPFRLELSTKQVNARQSNAHHGREHLNFHGCEISGHSFEGLELSFWGLSQALLRKCDFSELKAKGADFHSTLFQRCEFRDSNLSEVIAHFTIFENCEFWSCDWTGFHANETVFRDCRFEVCKFQNVDWDSARVEDCAFKDCEGKLPS